jgi:transcriptional regulator with XRE-family HTH domain
MSGGVCLHGRVTQKNVMPQFCNKSAPIRNEDCDKMFAVGQRIYFSEWLQAEMDKRGWSQSDLARYADLNRAVINKLLNGKSHPQPPTLESISRALKVPIEVTYRAAGLLPTNPDTDDTIEEAIHVLKSIQSAQRKATAVALLKALINEEENEQRADKGKR